MPAHRACAPADEPSGFCRHRSPLPPVRGPGGSSSARLAGTWRRRPGRAGAAEKTMEQAGNGTPGGAASDAKAKADKPDRRRANSLVKSAKKLASAAVAAARGKKSARKTTAERLDGGAPRRRRGTTAAPPSAASRIRPAPDAAGRPAAAAARPGGGAARPAQARGRPRSLLPQPAMLWRSAGLDTQREEPAPAARLDAEACDARASCTAGNYGRPRPKPPSRRWGQRRCSGPRCSTSARIGKGAWMGTRPRNPGRGAAAAAAAPGAPRVAGLFDAADRAPRPPPRARRRPRRGGSPARRADDGGSSRRSGRDRWCRLCPRAAAAPRGRVWLIGSGRASYVAVAGAPTAANSKYASIAKRRTQIQIHGWSRRAKYFR